MSQNFIVRNDLKFFVNSLKFDLQKIFFSLLPDIPKSTNLLIFCSNLRLFDNFIPVSSNFQFHTILANLYWHIFKTILYCCWLLFFQFFAAILLLFYLLLGISTPFGWHRPVRQYERTNNSRTHRPNPPQIHVPNYEEKMGRCSNVSWLQRRHLDFLTYSSQSWYSKRIWCRSPPLFEIGE